MIARVETALFEIKKTASSTSYDKNRHISMAMSQQDICSLSKYITLSVGLKNICKAKDCPGNISPNNEIAPFIPSFIL